MAARDGYATCTCWDALLERLGGDNETGAVTVITAICQLRPDWVGHLVDAASKPTTPIVQRYRLLVLAGRVGGTCEPAQIRRLRALCRHRCPVIRQVAEEAIAAIAPEPRSRGSSRGGRRAASR